MMFYVARSPHRAHKCKSFRSSVMYDVRYSRFGRFPGKAGSRIGDRGPIMIRNDGDDDDEEITRIRNAR